MAPNRSSREPVPLNIWPCAQRTAQYQRAGRYLPESTEHPGKMLPELARRIIDDYSSAGDLVVDPMCGIGTTLVEGAALGRRCVGMELEERWAKVAEGNLDHILDADHRHLAEVRVGDARRLSRCLAKAAGNVDLVATSPPYACDAGTIDKSAWLAGRRMCNTATLNYSSRQANLGNARGRTYLTEMAAVYAACFEVLRPGGLLVTVTKNTRRGGRLFDLAGATVRLAHDVGFRYLQHVVALLAAVRDGGLVARPSFWQVTHLRGAHARGVPLHLVAHEDVLVFAKPELARG